MGLAEKALEQHVGNLWPGAVTGESVMYSGGVWWRIPCSEPD